MQNRELAAIYRIKLIRHRLPQFIIPTIVCLIFVQALKAETIQEVKWDPTDATEELQAAIDSGADTVLVKDHGLWHVGKVTLKSNQTILLEENVRLLALSGIFTRNHHKWFSGHQLENVKIVGQGSGESRPEFRMRKSEYMDDTNQRRMHILQITAARNIEVKNLIMRDSGGDGIALSGKDFLVEDCLIVNSKRGGMNTGNSENYTIRNCVVRGSNGVSPQYGIACEFHQSRGRDQQERARNLRIENCLIEKNHGPGIYFFGYGATDPLRDGGHRLSALVKDCTVRDNLSAGILVARTHPKSEVWGSEDVVRITGCQVINNGWKGNGAHGWTNLFIFSKSPEGPRVEIDNTAFAYHDGPTGPMNFPIMLYDRYKGYGLGNIHFGPGVRVLDDVDRPFLYCKRRESDDHKYDQGKTLDVGQQDAKPDPGSAVAITNVTGAIEVSNPFAGGHRIAFNHMPTKDFSVSIVSRESPTDIRPCSEYPRYWEYQGSPVVLLGGSKDDNLFQLPDLREHLDLLASVGGNYIRNTMSSRSDGGWEVQPFVRLPNGQYDLQRWNPEYWQRFENLLTWCQERDIVVQVELWAQWDFYQTRWDDSPWNPKNNVNYGFDNTTLAEKYGRLIFTDEKHDFFCSVPALANDQTLLTFQKRFVDKVLSLSLKHPNVLYTVTNEIFEQYSPEWGWHWAKYIKQRAGKTVYVTEMF